MSVGVGRIVEEANIDSALDARIKRSLCTCFPTEAHHFSQSRYWHGAVPVYSVIIDSDDEVAAHAVVVDRTIGVGQDEYRIGGVGNLFVLPPYRGQGLADRVMKAAMDEAGRRGIDYGMLFCLPALEKVYRPMGWRRIGRRRITIIDENQQERLLSPDSLAMYYPLHDAVLPETDIHLRGNDW